jgi:hypothetical protein
VRIDALARQGEQPGRKVHPLTQRFRALLDTALSGAGVQPDEVLRWREEGALLNSVAAVRLALCA